MTGPSASSVAFVKPEFPLDWQGWIDHRFSQLLQRGGMRRLKPIGQAEVEPSF